MTHGVGPGIYCAEIEEIVDEIAKSVIGLATNSHKTIHNKISESADRRIRARWNALKACRIDKIMCKGMEGKHACFLLTLVS